MSYSMQMKAMLYNPIGMWDWRITEIFWENYVNDNNRTDNINLKYKYA